MFPCKRCGQPLMVQQSSFAECRNCGYVQTVPQMENTTIQDVLSRAWQLFRSRDLNQASTLFNLAVSLSPEAPEGYWGRVLCRYGVLYTTQGIVCENCVQTGIAEDPDMAKVMENADPAARSIYAREANAIERQRVARLQAQNAAFVAQNRPIQKKQGKKSIWIACAAAALVAALALLSVFVLLPAEKGTPLDNSREENLNSGLPYVPDEEPDVFPGITPDHTDDLFGEAEKPVRTDVKIGAILVHDENSGYDMAHIEGLNAACEALGISKDNIVYKYNIPEDETCYDAAADLADDGCTIIFSDSYGHQTYMQQAAEEFEDVIFVACTGDMAANSDLDNLKNIFPYTYESRYVSGVVAGMKLKELMDAGNVTDPYVGYVGAFPYAEVVSGYTAFFLGIQSVVPEAHMDVQYTNSWYDPVGEAEAANALMSRGCVIIGQHADSTGAPSAVQAAWEKGEVVYSVGYNIDMLSVAPDAALTSAQNVWSVLYQATLEAFMNGEEIPTDYACGIAMGAQQISKLGPNVAEGTEAKVEETWNAIKDGSLKVFDTSKFTVGGETVTQAYGLDTDGDWVNDSGEAIVDGAFVESVLRSAPYFALRIDGIMELN